MNELVFWSLSPLRECLISFACNHFGPSLQSTPIQTHRYNSRSSYSRLSHYYYYSTRQPVMSSGRRPEAVRTREIERHVESHHIEANTHAIAYESIKRKREVVLREEKRKKKKSAKNAQVRERERESNERESFSYTSRQKVTSTEGRLFAFLAFHSHSSNQESSFFFFLSKFSPQCTNLIEDS